MLPQPGSTVNVAASQSAKSRNKLLKKHAVKSPGRSDRWVGFNGIEGLGVRVWLRGYPPGATDLGFTLRVHVLK